MIFNPRIVFTLCIYILLYPHRKKLKIERKMLTLHKGCVNIDLSPK